MTYKYQCQYNHKAKVGDTQLSNMRPIFYVCIHKANSLLPSKISYSLEFVVKPELIPAEDAEWTYYDFDYNSNSISQIPEICSKSDQDCASCLKSSNCVFCIYNNNDTKCLNKGTIDYWNIVEEIYVEECCPVKPVKITTKSNDNFFNVNCQLK